MTPDEKALKVAKLLRYSNQRFVRFIGLELPQLKYNLEVMNKQLVDAVMTHIVEKCKVDTRDLYLKDVELGNENDFVRQIVASQWSADGEDFGHEKLIVESRRMYKNPKDEIERLWNQSAEMDLASSFIMMFD